MRRALVFGALLALVIAGGIVFLRERPIAVQIAMPETQVPLRIYGLGTVEARVLSKVGFEVGGSLVSLLADSGDRVSRGQEIAVLNAAVQEARAERARAALAANSAALVKADAARIRIQAVLAQVQANNRRQQELARQNVTSTQRAEEAQRDENVARADLAVAEADVAVIRSQRADAEAALRQEEATLSQFRLKAPYDAVIISRQAEAGAVVKAGDPIFTLIDPGTVWIQIYIDEERAGQLALDQPATIRIRSQPQAQFTGRIVRIGLESDRVNEERRIWLVCENCPPQMYLGEQADARILTGVRESALMVPEMAIRGFDGRRGRVWMVRDGRLAEAEIALGARDDRGRVEVRGGLPDDARIVVSLPSGMRSGRRVRIEAQP
ncbi:MAG: efflux RND transporter periplasmic adaptor subunit [Rhizobiales bacterium]|nr:efflux RND transporter periplasmic adaptor subunit [Hyphomicrobiales bacterium]